jgi:DNA repair exonuclease SbcCD nuclease subunit
MIKKSKVAIFSDLHLGIYGNSPEWHEIALRWADWIVEELTLKKIKDIFFLGDFFHNRSEISVQTVHVASELIEKFKQFNLFMIVGNHDSYYKNRSDIHSLGMLRGHDNITIIDNTLEIEAFDKKIAFVPWNNELPEGTFDYIFGHFEIQSFKMNNFKVCDHGFEVMDFLASKTRNVYSGHFHTRSTKQYNEGMIHYVGNPFQMDFSDCGDLKGYYILDIESEKVEFFTNKVCPDFEKILLSRISMVYEPQIKGNFVKLIVDIDVDDDKLDKFKAHLNKFSPYRLTVEYNVSIKSVDNREDIDSINLEDMFEEFIDQLKLDNSQQQRIKVIIDHLYAKNNL